MLCSRNINWCRYVVGWTQMEIWRYVNCLIPVSALTVLVNTTVKLISINMRQTCGLTVYAKQHWKAVRAANTNPREPYRAAMFSEPANLQLKKNHTNISVTSMCHLKTTAPSLAEMPPLSILRTVFLICLSLLLPNRDVGTQSSTREKKTGKEISLKNVSEGLFAYTGKYLVSKKCDCKRGAGNKYSLRLHVGAKKKFWIPLAVRLISDTDLKAYSLWHGLGTAVLINQASAL